MFDVEFKCSVLFITVLIENKDCNGNGGYRDERYGC